jgi:hypothetical protein
VKTTTKHMLAVGRVRNGCCPWPKCREKALAPSAWPKLVDAGGCIEQELVCLSCGHTFTVLFRAHRVDEG